MCRILGPTIYQKLSRPPGNNRVIFGKKPVLLLFFEEIIQLSDGGGGYKIGVGGRVVEIFGHCAFVFIGGSSLNSSKAFCGGNVGDNDIF